MLRAEGDRKAGAALRVDPVADASLPTRHGKFRAMAFAVEDDPAEVLALVFGSAAEGLLPLVRLHSECLTGDALGSLRCDCGEQLDASLRLIAEAGFGVLLYLRQEGRGIGLINKLRAYALQDEGANTVGANKLLGLPVDGRRYVSAAAVLRHLGMTSIRLLTNNPAKRRALQAEDLRVVERVPLEMPPNPFDRSYLETKAALMGHQLPAGRRRTVPESVGTTTLPVLPVSPRPVPSRDPILRPSVTVHYAQTLDGRIATRTGHSQWISGPETLRFAHALRAAHDAVMVGVGTVVADDPRLTVRHVEGRSPLRVVVDSQLRLPLAANVIRDSAAPTLVATTDRAAEERVRSVQRVGVEVLVVQEDEQGRVDLTHLLRRLGERGLESVMIEGGARLITSALRLRVVDRLVVTIAPKLIGQGIEAVGDLDIARLSEAIEFDRAGFTRLGDDLVFDGSLR